MVSPPNCTRTRRGERSNVILYSGFFSKPGARLSTVAMGTSTATTIIVPQQRENANGKWRGAARGDGPQERQGRRDLGRAVPQRGAAAASSRGGDEQRLVHRSRPSESLRRARPDQGRD